MTEFAIEYYKAKIYNVKDFCDLYLSNSDKLFIIQYHSNIWSICYTILIIKTIGKYFCGDLYKDTYNYALEMSSTYLPIIVTYHLTSSAVLPFIGSVLAIQLCKLCTVYKLYVFSLHIGLETRTRVFSVSFVKPPFILSKQICNITFSS